MRTATMRTTVQRTMDPTLTRRGFCALAAGLALGAGTSASAQAWPAREVRLIVSGTPGQGTDVLSRLIAQELSKRLGKAFVVDNRAGAGGMIAADLAAKATPDGYTLLMATNATHAANAAMYPSIPYDPLKDFSPVGLVGLLPMVLATHSESGIRDVADLVRLARAKPGGHDVAVPSTSARVMVQHINALAGIELFPVPYKGSGPAFVDVMAGRLALTVDTISAALPHVQSGKLRLLGVTTAKRFDATPDVPTLAEAGLSGFDLAPWNALMGPAGLPPAVVQSLNTQLQEILRDPAVRQQLLVLGILPSGGTPGDLQAFVASEHRMWGDLVRKAKITAN